MCSCAFYCCTACFHISKLSSNTAYRVHFHCITTSPASILISRLNKLLERITTAHPSSHHKTILMIPMILFLTSFICLHCCCWASRIYVYWNCCLQQHFILLSCLLLYAVNSVDSICIVLVPIIGRNSSFAVRLMVRHFTCERVLEDWHDRPIEWRKHFLQWCHTESHHTFLLLCFTCMRLTPNRSRKPTRAGFNHFPP